jgi:hypothetical protein
VNFLPAEFDFNFMNDHSPHSLGTILSESSPPSEPISLSFVPAAIDLEQDFTDDHSSHSLSTFLTDYNMTPALEDGSSRDYVSSGVISIPSSPISESGVVMNNRGSTSMPQFLSGHSTREMLEASFGISRTPSEALNPFPRYQEPRLEVGSWEMLTHFFQRRTCNILSVKNDNDKNPWQTLVWPLVKENPALDHAIAAMTCLHMSRIHPQLRSRGLRHLRLGMEDLTAQRSGGRMRLDAALAATLALGFAETWDHQRSSTGYAHIQKAQDLVHEISSAFHSSQFTRSQRRCLNFLTNTWIYMDVIARLTTSDVRLPIDFTFMNACNNLNVSEDTPQIDPLMGCAVTLFPIIGRVADLVGCIWNDSAKGNSPAIISQAVELLRVIECWSPTVDLCASEDSPSVISDSIQTAEAYRWATLLLLYQAVPAIPSLLSLQELAQKVLVFIATIPISSGTTIVQIFPLLAAGCEIVNEEERKWVRERWVAMAKRMITGIVDRCLNVTVEVWRRRDQQQSSDQSCAQILSSLTSGLRDNAAIEGVVTRQDMEVDEVLTESRDIGTSNNDVATLQMPSRLIASTKCTNKAVVTKLPQVRKPVANTLHWLGVMRDWKWESKMPKHIILFTITETNNS